MIGLPLMHDAIAWADERRRASDNARSLLAAVHELRQARAWRTAGRPAQPPNRATSWLAARLRKLND